MSFWIVAFLVVFAIFVGLTWFGWAVRRSSIPATRDRIFTIFHLAGTATAAESARVDRFLRFVELGRLIAFSTLAFGVIWMPTERSDAPVIGRVWVAMMTGYFVGGAVGCALAMRSNDRGARRASLVPRDTAAYAPRVCVVAVYVIGSVTVIAGAVMLLTGTDLPREVGFGICGAALAMSFMPLGNRLARMRMPISAGGTPRIEPVLRHTSVRMVAGNALGLAGVSAAALFVAIVGAGNDDIVGMMLALTLATPFLVVGEYLQPGRFVPRRLLRWLDTPKTSIA